MYKDCDYVANAAQKGKIGDTLDSIKSNILPARTTQEQSFTDRLDSIALSEQKSFVGISDCVIDHVISCDNLSASEKLYYLVNDFYSVFLKNWKNKTLQFSAKKIGFLLGFSKSKIFAIQKKLEAKDYLQIIRTTDQRGKNNVNVPITTLPQEVFNKIIHDSSNREGVDSLNFDELISREDKREIISFYKQFIPINFELARFVFFNKNLSVNSKILFFRLFSVIHKIKQKHKYPIYAGSVELANIMNSCKFSRSTLFRALKQLEQENLIRREKLFVKEGDNNSNKFGKIVQYFEILLPSDLAKNNSEVDNIRHKKPEKFLLKSNHLLGVSLPDPSCVINEPPIYTYKNEHKKINKKIDKKRNICNKKSNFLYKNFKDSFSRKKEARNSKQLEEFYPLSQQDAIMLNHKSGRNFSLRVINEILLDISRKLKNRTFKSKKTFLNYMSKILRYEKRQSCLVNNENFRIKANYKEEDYKQIKAYEKKIEKLFCQIEEEAIIMRSDYNQFKAKIINILPTNIAYELVKNMSSVKIILQETEGKAQILLTKQTNIDITDLQYELILNQISAVYGSGISGIEFIQSSGNNAQLE